jgi:hypothetical protein
MKTNFKLTGLLSIFLVFSLSTYAAESAFEDVQYDSESQILAITPNPSSLWEEYLTKSDIIQGTNTKKGRVFLIGHGMAVVGAKPSDKNFMDSRNTAYAKALLVAKSDLAEAMKTDLSSSRSLIAFSVDGEIPDRLKEEIVEPLSIMDKINTLSDLALDDQIKKYNPSWDGKNKSKDEKINLLASSVERYKETLSSRAEMFLQGATPIFNAEGMEDGNYVVVVGMVWSWKSTMVAESIYNPSVAPPIGRENSQTIKERLNNLSDKELAASLGVRIWWDENGLPVIISFAQAKGTGSPIIAKKRTALRARTQIAQFVAENVVSNANEMGGEEIQFNDDDSYNDFNLGEFDINIKAESKKVQVSGLGSVLYKKITHPNSEKKIIVNVIMWSPEADKLARDLTKVSEEQLLKMQATDGGTIFENYEESSEDNSVGTISTIGLEGVSSDSDDF